MVNLSLDDRVLSSLESRCREHMIEVCAQDPDSSHDLLHVERVVATARSLAQREGADPSIVLPAAWLHDCVFICKTDSRRRQASRLSGARAVQLLSDWGYPESRLPAVRRAIESHSFSSGIAAETLEARIVQDADRLDAMGAIGAFRCFAFSGRVGRPLYSRADPFADERTPDDQRNTLDHFFVKLLKLADRLHTPAARAEGQIRLHTMRILLEALRGELRA